MNCRVCGHDLETVLDLGEQCLSGQFPKIGEPDPPRFPLVLARCVQCKLMQLRDTVDPKLMFGSYWYKSGVTQTMRDHLKALVKEAIAITGRDYFGLMQPCFPKHVLDIGCNDGTLLSEFSNFNRRVGIDPGDAGKVPKDATLIKGLYPHADLIGQKFDLIFSIACFYDTHDPVAFARALRDNLAPGGLWCVEVSDVNAVLAGAWDSICHEHLLYFDSASLYNVAAAAGLHLVRHDYNRCNGGSLRCYFSATDHQNPYAHWATTVGQFSERVQKCKAELRNYLADCWMRGKKVHLLGASTKANTVLQYCGITPDLIQYASDRDPRKVGCCTPGTRIPIISEADSRAMKPDVYVCLIHGFKDEVIAREQAFLDAGGTILFPLPFWDEVKR